MTKLTEAITCLLLVLAIDDHKKQKNHITECYNEELF